MPTYSKAKKYTTPAELTQQTVMIKISQATLAKIDAIEAGEPAKGSKLADIRGAKVESLMSGIAQDDDTKKEVERLQIQLATTKAQWVEAAKKADALEAQTGASAEGIKELQDKLATAKDLADSRNRIIRALKSIVDEVGF